MLILTASTDAATKRQALDLGAADFLPKPVDPTICFRVCGTP